MSIPVITALLLSQKPKFHMLHITTGLFAKTERIFRAEKFVMFEKIFITSLKEYKKC